MKGKGELGDEERFHTFGKLINLLFPDDKLPFKKRATLLFCSWILGWIIACIFVSNGKMLPISPEPPPFLLNWIPIFPVGLTLPFTHYALDVVIYPGWAFYLIISALLLITRKKMVFIRAYMLFLFVFVLNIGGCIYITR